MASFSGLAAEQGWWWRAVSGAQGRRVIWVVPHRQFPAGEAGKDKRGLGELWVRGDGGGQEALEARDLDGGADPELLNAASAVEHPGGEQREREPAEGDGQREELWW